MKRSPALKIAIILLIILCCYTLFAKPPKLPPNYPPAQYDEEKVPKYTLPETLVLLNGEKVTDINTWKEKRRPEIIKLFEEHVYGHTMVGRPKEMSWEVISQDPNASNRRAVAKTVAVYFKGTEDGPKMNLNILLPTKHTKPVPVFVIPWGVRNPANLLKRGYGLVTFMPFEIEPDKKDGYEKSIRKAFANPGQTHPEPNEWGALGAWAWAMSRAMDYIETDPDIDASKVCALGFSRYGKAAMWAGAQDERFAIVFSGQSGCGGVVIVRRGYGETVRSINEYAPHWFCGNFKTYGNRVNELPVDWHMLVALMAPRPVFINTGEQNYWSDPRGSFLSAKGAEP
ncbi:MAG: hypothetical protein PVG93_03160, partial [Phycisphaerales bacterium]